jgi:hypothetical protein
MVDRISESIRRTVFVRALGRCEYGRCSKISARCQEDGSIVGPGEFCHILPFADKGPRSEYKQQFPGVKIDSAENVVLLCREHHRAVDVEQIARHPPALLFEMATRKSAHMSEAVAEAFDRRPYVFDYEEVARDLRVGRIFDLMNEASIVGPKKGRPLLKRATVLLRDLHKNPFAAVPPDLIGLIALELAIQELINSHLPERWMSGLSNAERALRKFTDGAAVASAVLLLMVYVRDEYGVFSPQERLRLIKVLLDYIDPLIKSTTERGLLAFLFGIKAGLLRWRGRLQESKDKILSYGEAERCAERSIDSARSPAGRLQLALVKFAKSRSLSLPALSQHDELLTETVEILDSDELNGFPPAIKYRPRFYRDNYEFQLGIDAFWRAVDDGFRAEMKKDAYVLGECATSMFLTKSLDSFALTRALEFLHDAIHIGFDHGRNFIAWISCRAYLEPDWFQEHVMPKFQIDDLPANPMMMLKDQSMRYFGNDSFSHDTLFGVNEIEFWNMLARLCRTALNDPIKALAYYDVASRYRGRGRFTTDVGKFRTLLQIGELVEAKRALNRVRNSALAFQARILSNLEASFRAATLVASPDGPLLVSQPKER